MLQRLHHKADFALSPQKKATIIQNMTKTLQFLLLSAFKQDRYMTHFLDYPNAVL
jgi:hypothetical protein